MHSALGRSVKDGCESVARLHTPEKKKLQI